MTLPSGDTLPAADGSTSNTVTNNLPSGATATALGPTPPLSCAKTEQWNTPVGRWKKRRMRFCIISHTGGSGGGGVRGGVEVW